MQQMREEKESNQRQLHEAQKYQITMAENYSRKLEADVFTRTEQLTVSNIELMAQREALHAKTEELVATQQRLVASEKMAALGVFTAGMAHEINNPANFVSVGAQNTAVQLAEFRGFVSDLLSDDPDPEITEAFDTRFRKLEKSNSTIAEGISRIEKVVKQLRADHPEGDTGMQPADVVASLESASRTIMLSLESDITLTTDFCVRPIVPCLIAEVQQVFLALLSNAAHAIEDAVAVNGPDYKGEIKLASLEADGKLVITVSDNGIGIPADKIDKIFDPFFTTKTVGRGAGLGLSMARDVVKKHHGTLEVESTVGEGTTFTLELGLTQPG
jgi:signal transduction histidine kinase